MNFRTEITPERNPAPILHTEKILTIGSCFADNIGSKLQKYKFTVLQNPFGVLYNPVSIKQSLQLLTGERKFSEDQLFLHLNEWHSFYHHSTFSSENKQRTAETIKDQILFSGDFLKKADIIIITLGTAFVYRHKMLDMVVSNCHKIPAAEFERNRLSVNQIENELSEIISAVTELNRNTRFIFTVSPIRHWKDGAVENQLSKSSLLIAVSEIIKKNRNCRYFPSYEIMMDDLRDYRFYEPDMLHPNQSAIDYIWEKFVSAEISKKAEKPMKDFEKLFLAVKHRPINPDSANFKKFVADQLQKIQELGKTYPYVDLSDETNAFKQNKGQQ